MPRYLLIIFFSLLLQLQEGIAQSSPASTPAIIKHLLSQQKEIPVISGSFLNRELLKILPRNEMPKQLWPENQYLLYTPGSLYLGIDGTGRLYKIKTRGDALNFIREDSTFYLGNNFDAFNFSIGDTLYSFGGYGFWKNNGMLRYYNRVVHEWEVIKTNREINTHTGISGDASYFWVDDKNNRFYLAGQKIVNDGLKPQLNSSELKNKKLFVLDITKREWTELGVLKDYPDAGSVNSPWGPLIIGPFISYINDFIRNRELTGKKPVIEQLKKVFSGHAPDVAYFIDSTLYFSNINLNSFDSVQLSINDFEYRGEKVFTPLASKIDIADNKDYLLWLAVIPVAVLLFLIIYRNKKRKKVRQHNIDEILNHQNGDVAPQTDHTGTQKFNGKNGNHSQGFSAIEKELILFIYEKTLQEYTVSVEEINKVLGLSGKNESVQKKNRSENINIINQKWSVLYGNNHPLIDRQRSEFDKRSFEYFIRPIWLEKLDVWLTAEKDSHKNNTGE